MFINNDGLKNFSLYYNKLELTNYPNIRLFIIKHLMNFT